jgi:hypothetical protein
MTVTTADRQASWAGLALAPTSWYAMHVAISSLTPAECDGWPATILLAALAAALTAAGGVLSYRYVLRAEPGEDSTRRFVGWIGVAASLLFLFVIACQGAAGLLYTGCER